VRSLVGTRNQRLGNGIERRVQRSGHQRLWKRVRVGRCHQRLGDDQEQVLGEVLGQVVLGHALVAQVVLIAIQTLVAFANNVCTAVATFGAMDCH
jgi:hypothetical protein